MKYKPKKVLTLPLIKKVDGETVFIKVMSPVFKGKEYKGTGETAKMEPADLVNCINLENGEESQIIINKVILSVWQENYKKDEYVGRCFAITQYQQEGKRYKSYKVIEIEDPINEKPR